MTDNDIILWRGVSTGVDETLAIGRALGTCLQAQDVVALVGELGAGKTQLVRGLAEGMQVDTQAVASPTFVLMHEYAPRNTGTVLVHIDAYRLRSLEDLESIGWTEHESQAHDGLAELRRGAVVAIEWADRLGDLLGNEYLQIELEHERDDQRRITVKSIGWSTQRAGLLTQALHRLRLDKSVAPQAPAQKISTVQCPICKKVVQETEKTFPFCSARCRMVDLGRWMGGNYKISRPLEQRDLEEGVD